MTSLSMSMKITTLEAAKVIENNKNRSFNAVAGFSQKELLEICMKGESGDFTAVHDWYQLMTKNEDHLSKLIKKEASDNKRTVKESF